ncbi:SRPBCC family protein [Georgenia sp. MJ170]|uniref:SRPBCC family protein n=1 Tax=Georgenia sunbinii TaxID=3117728 RepID=UPI002F266979
MAGRELDLTPEQAFRLVAAVGEHGRWVPFTRVSVPAPEPRAGDLVVARTAGLFVDRMRVVMVAPPRRLVLAKVGPVLLGSATITVTPAGTRARVSWTYDARLRGPLPAALTGPALNHALDAMAALALWRMDRWVRHTRPAPPLP